MDDACLNTDILLASDRDTWVRCAKARGWYGGLVMSVIIFLVILLVFFLAKTPLVRYGTLVIGSLLIALMLFGNSGITGWIEGRRWDTLKVEYDNMAAKDPSINWTKFVEYKRAQQAQQAQETIATAQSRQAMAQGTIAATQVANTAMNVASFFK